MAPYLSESYQIRDFQRKAHNDFNMWVVRGLTFGLCIGHTLIGGLSMAIGVVETISAEIWMAHRVSPVWSGGFFLLTAVFGFIAARKRNGYLIMCFGAFCVVSMVVAIVNIQLLRLGLVTHFSDRQTFRKDEIDAPVIMAMCASGVEILLSIISLPVSYIMSARADKEVHMQRDGTFSIQILGDEDIVIQQSTDRASYERLYSEIFISSQTHLDKVSESEVAINSTEDKSLTIPESTNTPKTLIPDPKHSESLTPLIREQSTMEDIQKINYADDISSDGAA